ncbi:MAG: porin [Gammaproteobacteria bacterium]|nr:porin [Gammaproteobacteria bacterium]
MKKILAVAVAAAIMAPLAASADTTLYGRINNSIVHTDPDGGDSNWDVMDNASRLGVKGSEDLGNGLKAVFQVEFALDSDTDGGLTGGRLAYVGLAGDFGTVAVGQQWTPYYGAVDNTDIFQAPGMNDHYLGPFRTGDALAYVSPDFSGFTGKVALIMDGNNDTAAVAAGLDPVFNPAVAATTDSNSIDAYNVSLQYSNGPLSLGASVLDFDDETADLDVWGISGSYNFGMFAVMAQYEDMDDAGVEIDEFALAGEAYFGNNTLRAAYGQVDAAGTEFDVISVGAQHSFSKSTRVFVEYGDSEVDSAKTFGIGIRHDF